MTHTPEEPNEPDEGRDPRDPSSGSGGAGAGRKLDEDAAWRDIVANYGERPSVDAPSVEPAETPLEPPPPPADRPRGERPRRRRGPSTDDAGDPGRDERLRGLFQPSWNDPLNSGASYDDEGHFVPPDPPPVHVTDPRRRAAWAGLFGAPLIMLVAVVLGWTLPGWAMLGLAGGFAGGFVYLVATMPNRRGPGDDGAVV